MTESSKVGGASCASCPLRAEMEAWRDAARRVREELDRTRDQMYALTGPLGPGPNDPGPSIETKRRAK